MSVAKATFILPVSVRFVGVHDRVATG